MKNRFTLFLNCLLLIALILSACAGIPGLSSTPTPVIPTPTFLLQSSPPALVETVPPLDSVIGHLSPITFYFNQPMNKASVESSFSGLPAGTFTWKDEATLLFTPAESYPPNTKLNIALSNSIQSGGGFGITDPIELTFSVADYLRATNLLPRSDASDVNVDSAIVASFNQPVVSLGVDDSVQPSAFSMEPSVPGRGDWINTSTYIFYPEASMAGGLEYTVSLNMGLKTAAGVGMDGSGRNVWKFVTARPRVVTLSPSTESPTPLDAEIKLTFNQPMNPESVQANFLLSGTDGPVSGIFSWNEGFTELTFVPENLLARNVGYLLNVNGDALSGSGVTLGDDYGTVLRTFDNFAVTGTETNFGSTTFTFNSLLAEEEYEKLVSVSPAVDNFAVNVDANSQSLYVYGDFLPDANYVIELAAQVKDRWGQSLGDPFVLNLHTPPLPPALSIKTSGSGTAFVRPDEPVLFANITNIQTAEVTLASLSVQDYIPLINSYENQQAYVPASASTTLPQTVETPSNQAQVVKFSLTLENNQLPTGLYYVNLTSPQLQTGNAKNVYFVASSQVNLTLKVGGTEAFVWAVDLPSQSPVADAPVVIYDNAGNSLGSGTTDTKGLWKGPVDAPENSLIFAVLGQPGDENFALAVSNWSNGFNAGDFGYSQRVQKPHTEIYLYTDRPIYRPGQTVYFRGVARQAFNGRYELPTVNTVPINLTDAIGTQLLTLNAQLSPYGTFNGQFDLPAEAVPGYYSFSNSSLEFNLSFQVAEYRKPEINLAMDFSAADIKPGDPAQANVNARYFFDAPAGDVPVKWTLYARPDYFDLPNYQTGLVNDGWLDVFRFNPGVSTFLGTPIGEGTGQTNPDGTLSIELPAIPETEAGQLVTLEVTAEDESGFPVSARAEVRVHPADFYVGLRADQWIGTAKSALGFDVLTVDWSGMASGDKTLAAEFKQVKWEKETDRFGFPTYTPVYTPVSSSNLATGPDGRARLSFIPPNAGTFMLEVGGSGARTQTLIWVGGAGTAAWPDLPNQRLEITADKKSYDAGETAKVFIPNPFATNSLALVTVERGMVSKAEVITLGGSGKEYSLPLTADDAPNVYVSVTALGQGNEFRHGLVNIPVAPDAQSLNVQVTSNPAEAGPRDEVTFDVAVTNNEGQPVEGEFSLSVVDLATLALADPNAQDILPAFYSNQPLGVQTGLSLAAYGGRDSLEPGGLGGGGGGDITVLREDFPDTAYWNPSLITNSEGRGQARMTLPDSLTTWQVDVRGLTVDTKVGQAETQIVSTKPLLVRPVTPRFLVNGDHVLMAAIVNNNTANKLKVSVNLQSEGFVLDEPGKATQQVDVPANGRTRVEWWGTAGLADSADLIFSARTTGTPSLQDSTRPVWGKLPILQYTSPQAFVTGGVMREAGTQQEAISLPRTFTPTSGGLEVELSPSLAGSLLSALEAMEAQRASSNAEGIASYILPNIEVYRALSSAGLNDPSLTDRITSNMNSSVSRLFYLQNTDGGWNWWGTSPLSGGTEEDIKSDPYNSAYVFFCLLRAREAGAPMNEEALQRAGNFLRDLKPVITIDTGGAALDEFAFVQFALSHANSFDETKINELFNARDRMSPSGRALLAFTIFKFNAADPRTRDIVSNLESSAVLSASGAHWETAGGALFTRGSTIYTTSLVVYALAQVDPANQVLFNAVRYLAAHRNASRLWNLGHDHAWAILALNAAMTGFGDLRADFSFDAALNGGPLMKGDIAGIQITPQIETVPLEFLSPNSPNLLIIHREDGLGRLYYNATLRINRPVEDVKPLNQGMQIERVYCKPPPGKTQDCTPLSSLQLASDQQITAQLTLILPHDSYYVMVEDFIPAGMEILDRNLKTSQLGINSTDVQVQFKDEDPFANGWGWWLFNEPQIRDDSILFTADSLPAGTYVLTYTLTPLQAGEYRVLPAHAWQAFFPEVQGTSAGMVFEVKP